MLALGAYKLSVLVTVTHKFSDQLGLHLWVWKFGEYIDEYYKLVPCAIGHYTESRPQ